MAKYEPLSGHVTGEKDAYAKISSSAAGAVAGIAFTGCSLDAPRQQAQSPGAAARSW
jgi:hypothetical protein